MEAALAHLVGLAAGRRTVAMLGAMAELGPDASRYHREVGQAVARAGIDVLIAVGPLARGYVDPRIPRAEWVETVPEGIDVLRSLLQDGDSVLVKGSRALGMERVAEALTVARTA